MDRDQLHLGRTYARARSFFPDQTVHSVVDGEQQTLTYRDLFARVDRLAHALRELGVQPGDRVATLGWNHHRHLEVYLAATWTGAVLHTINVRITAAQVAAIASDARDVVIFYDEDVADLAIAAVQARTPAVVPLVCFGSAGTVPPDGQDVLDYEGLLASQSSDPYTYPELGESHPAATCYSSATTGTPKGVVYSHRSQVLHAAMLSHVDTWGLGRRDVVLPVVPMFHVNAWGLPFAAIAAGATLVLPGARPRPELLVDLVEAFAVTLVAAVPTVWSDVFDVVRRDPSVDVSSLRLAVCGGAPLSRALIDQADRLAVPLVHSYGMTEASPLVLVGERRAESNLSDDASTTRRLRQGRVVPGVEFRVVDDAGGDVPWDGASIGELWLRGPWIAEEYPGDARSASAFTADGWYLSGDVVTIDRDGLVQLVDRQADLIKGGGEWISSVDVENALMEHPRVRSAAVAGVPDERWQERPWAFVVVEDSFTTDDDLRRHLDSRLSKFWVPDRFVRVDEVPLTSVGKFDKRALRASAATLQAVE